MYKKIPGSLYYRIDLNCEIVDSRGQKLDIPNNNGFIEIELFGIKKKLRLEWLSLMAWYETFNMYQIDKHLDKISFSDLDNRISRIKCNKIMCFATPIYYDETHRIIPNHVRYAIDVKGEIIDTATNEVVTNISIDHGYPVAYIYNPDKSGNRNMRLHRLLALAWLQNDDFVNKPILNHIDGDRANCTLTNLEWCSYSDNAQHACDMGLNDCKTKMKIRDRLTGKISIFNSVTDMSRTLGMPNISRVSYTGKLPGYLYKNRYEIKDYDDQTPWFYESSDIDSSVTGKSIYTITVFDKVTGITKIYNNTRVLCKAYDIPVQDNIETAISIFKERYKDCDIVYIKNMVHGPYEVLNILTKDLVILNSIVEVGKHINHTRTELQYDLSKRLKYIYDEKWIVIPKNERFYTLSDYINKPKPYCSLLVENINNKTTTYIKSVHEANRVYGIERKTILNKIDTGISYKGLIFRTAM